MNAVVRIGVGGDLREGRDAEHLAVLGDLVDLATNDFGDRPTNSCIDFVEDVKACGAQAGEDAQHSQVLCITHLPQISAYADAHYRVHKEVVGKRTKSDIRLLSDTERLEEIARMLGGVTVTDQARAAAQELIRSAEA